MRANVYFLSIGKKLEAKDVGSHEVWEGAVSSGRVVP